MILQAILQMIHKQFSMKNAIKKSCCLNMEFPEFPSEKLSLRQQRG